MSAGQLLAVTELGSMGAVVLVERGSGGVLPGLLRERVCPQGSLAPWHSLTWP
ncbi:hypothetical protein [Streptomyces sp. NBC_00343]|uniref:hypothetical protein n=1 Tax=Streptomyces sp. NBC_00343 TaxID=2975719 RepID=UPI002E2A20BD|nr:hypothetical protein [Streptomyces sp. NBC_00343]